MKRKQVSLPSVKVMTQYSSSGSHMRVGEFHAFLLPRKMGIKIRLSTIATSAAMVIPLT